MKNGKSGNHRGAKKKEQTNTKKKQDVKNGFKYPIHWSEERVEKELKLGKVFQTTIRYNATDTSQAFCSVEGIPTDVFICDPNRQNRSMHGDLVVIKILPPSQWHEMGARKSSNASGANVVDTSKQAQDKAPLVQSEGLSMISLIKDMLQGAKISNKSIKQEELDHSLAEIRHLLETSRRGWRATGEVVRILKRSERCFNIVGCIKQDKSTLLFYPLDKRLPVSNIVDSHHIYDHEKDHTSKKAGHYFEAKLVHWGEKDKLPQVQLKSILGRPGKLETDIQAVLSSENINDDTLFDDSVLECLPSTPWKIPDSEYYLRKDLRSKRVFSIDPETAKDLDDALSIESIGKNSFRIGVHIADVSFFVEPGTQLDKAAQGRSTSVYLVDRVIPMLPRVLCEHLCSLNPGTERLAMSIMWDVDSEGKVSNIWAGRTIIRSCVKLSYKIAQNIIDTFDSSGDVPLTFDSEVHNNHSKEDVMKDVVHLHKIAQDMRQKRYENGSLRLDNSKVMISLDEGNPKDFSLYQTGSANHLVEEFMLAANIEAANIISEAYSDNSLLRMHPEPNIEKLNVISELFSEWLPSAPKLVTNSAATIQKSLKDLQGFYPDNPDVVEVMTFMCTKPMQMALYFNTGDVEKKELWRHYALSIARYTHFTSPIRRYPDIIVHRLLMAAIWNIEKPDLGSASISKVAEHANERKAVSKAIQDKVSKLYLIQLFLKNPRILSGIVIGLGGPKYFDVYIPDIGMDIRVYAEDLYFKGLDIRTMWNPVKKYVILVFHS